MSDKRLLNAIEANDYAKVKDVLEKGAEIEAWDEDGLTPLMIAAEHSTTPEIITLLLAKGAEVNATGRDDSGSTALLLAVENPSTTPEIVRVLLAKGAEVK